MDMRKTADLTYTCAISYNDKVLLHSAPVRQRQDPILAIYAPNLAPQSDRDRRALLSSILVPALAIFPAPLRISRRERPQPAMQVHAVKAQARGAHRRLDVLVLGLEHGSQVRRDRVPRAFVRHGARGREVESPAPQRDRGVRRRRDRGADLIPEPRALVHLHLEPGSPQRDGGAETRDPGPDYPGGQGSRWVVG